MNIPGKDNGDGTRHFTSEEVESLVYDELDGCKEVKRSCDDTSRWYQSMTSVVLLPDGDYYELHWSQGLTEMQDNEFPCQDAERLHEVTTVTASVFTSYISDDDENGAVKERDDAMSAYASLLTDDGRMQLIASLDDIRDINPDDYARFDWSPEAEALRVAATKYFSELRQLASLVGSE